MRTHTGKVYKTLAYMVIVLFILWITGFEREIPSNAAEIVESELIILIDSSSSVKNKKVLSEWAIKLGDCAQDTGIKVSLIKFGGIGDVKELYSGKIISENNEAENQLKEEYAACVNNIAFYAEWTDQTGAFKYAAAQLDNSTAKRKCILMLSDADLDYQNDSGEESARTTFKTDVNQFANEKNQDVILVDFGSTNPDKINLYEGCEYAESFDCTGLEVKELEKELEKILWILLGKTGIVIENDPVELQNNLVTYDLKKDCYRMILNINSSYNIDEELINAITVTKGETVIDKTSYSLFGNSCFIFFSNPTAERYTFTIPNDDWKCCIIKQEKMIIDDIILSIAQGDNKIAIGSDNIYHIGGDSFKLIIDVKTQLSNPDPDLNYLSIEYKINPMSEYASEMSQEILDSAPKKYCEINQKEIGNSGGYEQTINLKQFTDTYGVDVCYECQVRIRQGNAEEDSDIIVIKADSPIPTCTPVKNEVVTEVNIKEQIDIYQAFCVPSNDKDCALSIKSENIDDVVRIGGSAKEDEYIYSNGNLSFLKEGSYMVSIITSNYDEILPICYKVIDNRSYCEKIEDWLKNLWN